MAEGAKWYVVHTYSGYENAVKASIDQCAAFYSAYISGEEAAA